jgi:hypothetical protein
MADKLSGFTNNVNVDDVIAEMEDSTRDYLESRGKVVPERAPKENVHVQNDDLDEGAPQNVPYEEETKEEPARNESRYSDYELAAMKKGWVPEDKYKGDKREFRSAKEFLGRADLYDKLSAQSRAIKKMEETVRLSAELHRKQHEMIQKDRLKHFEYNKKAAIELGSVADVEKYEQHIAETKKELDSLPLPDQETQQHRKQSSQQMGPPPEVQDFLDRNPWSTDKSDESRRMQRYAVAFETELARDRPELSVEERLFETEREVKRTFAHNFENRNRARAPSINQVASENISMRTAKPAKHVYADLPSNIKQQVKMMARHSGLSLDDYAQQLYDTGVLKDE